MAFFTGIGLMVWETVIDKAEHLVVYGPAFLLTGLPIARGVEKLLDQFMPGAGGPGSPELELLEPEPGPEPPAALPPGPDPDASPRRRKGKL